MRYLLLLLLLCSPLSATAQTADNRSFLDRRLDSLIVACGSRWGTCSSRIGGAQLLQYSAIARKHIDTLQLRLRSGAWRSLAPSPTSDWPASYQLYAYLKPLGFFLIHLQYAEGDAYAMVHDSSGRMTFLDDLPRLSPDHLRLVVASGDVEANYNPNTLTILRISGDTLLVEYRVEPDDWTPANAVWSRRELVRFVRLQYDSATPNGSVVVKQLDSLLLTPAGWVTSESPH